MRRHVRDGTTIPLTRRHAAVLSLASIAPLASCTKPPLTQDELETVLLAIDGVETSEVRTESERFEARLEMRRSLAEADVLTATLAAGDHLDRTDRAFTLRVVTDSSAVTLVSEYPRDNWSGAISVATTTHCDLETSSDPAGVHVDLQLLTELTTPTAFFHDALETVTQVPSGATSMSWRVQGAQSLQVQRLSTTVGPLTTADQQITTELADLVESLEQEPSLTVDFTEDSSGATMLDAGAFATEGDIASFEEVLAGYPGNYAVRLLTSGTAGIPLEDLTTL